MTRQIVKSILSVCCCLSGDCVINIRQLILWTSSESDMMSGEGTLPKATRHVFRHTVGLVLTTTLSRHRNWTEYEQNQMLHGAMDSPLLAIARSLYMISRFAARPLSDSWPVLSRSRCN
jgi:hypothetical protein